MLTSATGIPLISCCIVGLDAIDSPNIEFIASVICNSRLFPPKFQESTHWDIGADKKITTTIVIMNEHKLLVAFFTPFKPNKKPNARMAINTIFSIKVKSSGFIKFFLLKPKFNKFALVYYLICHNLLKNNLCRFCWFVGHFG